MGGLQPTDVSASFASIRISWASLFSRVEVEVEVVDDSSTSEAKKGVLVSFSAWRDVMWTVAGLMLKADAVVSSVETTTVDLFRIIVIY